MDESGGDKRQSSNISGHDYNGEEFDETEVEQRFHRLNARPGAVSPTLRQRRLVGWEWRLRPRCMGHPGMDLGQ